MAATHAAGRSGRPRIAALRAGSALYMPRALSSAAQQFGSIGLAFTFVSWLFAAALVLTASAAIGATLSRTAPA